MRTLAALSVAILVSACASGPAFQPERFLQIRPKASDVVLVQVVLKNGPECFEILDRIRYDVDNAHFPGTSASCSAIPASNKLPFGATVLGGQIKVIFDIESDSLEHCNGAVAIVKQGQISAGDADILRACQQIAGR
jgi:hypothetical protein